MKNIKLFIGAFLVALQLPLSIFSQPGITSDKNVVFIHGLNGNSNSWQPFTSLFTGDRRMSADRPAHNSSGGISGASSQISSSNFGTQSLTIGHSFGGVIARHLNNTGQKVIGGLITVGSPLDGAPIANALSDGSASIAILNSASILASGPMATIGLGNSVIPLISNQFGNFGADFLTQKMGEFLNVNNFGGSATVNDLKVGGGIEQDKNAAPTNTPKVSIWGNENSPTHWNILSTASGQNVPQIADDLSTIYQSQFSLFLNIGFVNLYNGSGHGFFSIAFQWYAGWQWIENDSEIIWNNLIGSDMVVQQCFTFTSSICTYPDERCDDTPGNWQYCQTICTPTTGTTCVQVHNNGISDAFIPAVSQRGLGSNSWRLNGQITPSVEAVNINHLQEIQPNAELGEMQVAFAKIFALNNGVDPIFRVNRR
jgi:pimeloyl-ACP methyl ester carboxylesterase